MGFLDTLFGGKAGGTGEAEETMQQQMEQQQKMLQQSLGYLSPYEQIGSQAMGDYTSALGQYADPTQLYSKIMGTYQQSPAAQFQEQQGMGQLQNTMESQGLAGSGQEAKDVLGYSQGLSSQDMQQYLQNTLGMGQTYLSGMGGVAQLGPQMAMQEAGLTQGTAGQLGGLSEALAQLQQQGGQSYSAGLMGLLGGGLTGLGSYAGGGGLSGLFGGFGSGLIPKKTTDTNKTFL